MQRKIAGFWFAGLLLVVTPSSLPAQRSVWNVVLAGGDTLSECAPYTLEDSVLTLGCGGKMVSWPIDSIGIIYRHKESHFWTGAGYGALGGAAVGAIIGAVAYTQPASASGQWFSYDPGRGAVAFGSGILGAAGGFAVGGIVGAFAGGDEVYQLSGQTRAMKRLTIQRVMMEEK